MFNATLEAALRFETEPFRDNKVTIHLVLDGSRNLFKKETNDARAQKREDAKSKFQEFLSHDRVYEEVELLHMLHEVVQPRIDIYCNLFKWTKQNDVKITAAPIESDWQLSFMSLKGCSDLVISKDGDVFACGAVLQATDIDWSKTDPLMTVWSQKKHMSFLMKHFGVDEDSECRLLDLLSIFIFMGCDYLSNVKDVGLAKLRKKGYFSKWLKADKEGKEAILDFIERKVWIHALFLIHSRFF